MDEAGDGGVGQGDAGAAGDVVQDDGDVHLAGDGLKVAKHAFLRRLVVVGVDEEGGIGAGIFREAGEVEGLVGGVGAGAGDDFHFGAFGGLDGDLDNVVVFFVGEGGGLAGGADGDDAIGAVDGLVFDLFFERGAVELAIEEGGHQGGKGTTEHGGSPEEASRVL